MNVDPSRADTAARSLGRRTVLKSGAVSASVALMSLMSRCADTPGGSPGSRPSSGPRAQGHDSIDDGVRNGGYGPLQPAPPHGELLLPAGFSYAAFGRTGTPMSDGTPTPGRHDGMAAFAGEDGMVRLVRNHELEDGSAFAGPAYDPHGPGGTTNLVFDPAAMALVASYPTLAGTVRNCAGGPTPRGTWLSCEETFTGLDVDTPHGYVFEVPVDAEAPVDPVPYRQMGRFTHEAVAVDPATGIVYETEDSDRAGFYRFLPRDRDNLGAGGRLQMLAIRNRAGFDARTGQRVGEPLPVHWVDIDDPDPDSDDPQAVFQQGRDHGGALFARLEGAWYGDGSVYVDSTNGGDAGLGQVWEYRPQGGSGGHLVLVYESTDPDVLQSPDNICVSPRTGGLVLCEDGAGKNLLRGVTTRGRVFDVAELADATSSELAGATFSPDGRTLFFNAQAPGITYAVTGPWDNGSL